MECYLIWPKRKKKSPTLPQGVHVVYEQGDEKGLFHLLKFLHKYFHLTERDLKKPTGKKEGRQFPDAWIEGRPILFKQLLKRAEQFECIDEWISLGFRHEHQLMFRAYKEHLHKDTDINDEAKEFFADIEEDFFGEKSRLH